MKPFSKPTVKTEVSKTTPVSQMPVADALVRVMDDLAALMEKEVVFLEKQDMASLSELLPLKHKLISTYIANMKSLDTHPDAFKASSSDIKARLKASGQRLEKSTARNALQFKGAVSATRRIINNVMGLIREETMPKHTAYGNPKLARFASGGYGGSHPSVAVNRTA